MVRVTEFPVDGYPAGIIAGADGALRFTMHDRIGRITTAGAVSTYPVSSATGPIAAGGDGALWFTHYGTNTIGRITTNGEVSELPVPTANSGASHIAAGPDGDIWFSETAANQLGRVLLPHPSTAPAPPTVVAPPASQPDVTAPILTLRAVKQSLGAVVRKGLAVQVASDEQCSLAVSVSVARAVARRLHLPATLASKRVALTQPTTLHVRFSERVIRSLRRERHVTFRVSSTATDAARNTGSTRSITVTVRR